MTKTRFPYYLLRVMPAKGGTRHVCQPRTHKYRHTYYAYKPRITLRKRQVASHCVWHPIIVWETGQSHHLISLLSWCLQLESNQRHENTQSSALPIELQRHIMWRILCLFPLSLSSVDYWIHLSHPISLICR